MKILYISQNAFRSIKGIEYTIKSVAERLAKRGHEVIVLCDEDKVKEVNRRIY